MTLSHRFPIEKTVIDGQWRRRRVVTCHKCGYPAYVTEKTGGLTDINIAKTLIRRGWRLNGRDVCPRCQQGKAPMAPAARRAAFCAIAKVPHKERAEPMTQTLAKAPPVASPEEKRRVRDALDMHYDEDAGRYRQSFSDEALAAKLDVPAKWVRDLREANGLGPNENEATNIRFAEIEALKGEIAGLQTDLLSRFDELERRLRKLNPAADLS